MILVVGNDKALRLFMSDGVFVHEFSNFLVFRCLFLHNLNY